MKEKKTRSPHLHSEETFKNDKDEKPDKRYPHPDGPNEEMSPPIKAIPMSEDPQHPHHEEMLDGTPK